MTGAERKNFDESEETTDFPKGSDATITVGGHTLTRAVLEPGWKWSESVGPLAGTDRCQLAHFGYIVSGSGVISWEDGTELEFRPGDVLQVPSGHDCRVVGDETVVFIDMQGLL